MEEQDLVIHKSNLKARSAVIVTNEKTYYTSILLSVDRTSSRYT
jgi:hypothetical protein